MSEPGSHICHRRVFERIQTAKPEMSNQKVVKIAPPRVVPYGSRKTMFQNFAEICNQIQRQVRTYHLCPPLMLVFFSFIDCFVHCAHAIVCST